MRATSHFAGLIALLVTACGGDVVDSVEGPGQPTVEASSQGAAPALEPPTESHPEQPPQALRPWVRTRSVGGPGSSPGHSFTYKYGGHVGDFPGPAAVIAPPEVPGRTLTLVPSGGDACAVDGPGVVVARPGPAVGAALSAGASLISLEGSYSNDGAAQRDAAIQVAEFADRSQLTVRGAVVAPAGLEGLVAVAATSQLVRRPAPPSSDLAPLAYRILREHGQRPVIDVPAAGLSDAALARALVGGATLWLERPLPRRQAALVAAAREQPGWFSRELSDLALVVPVATLQAGGPRAAALSAWLLRASAELERSHIAWRPALAVHGEPLSGDNGGLMRSTELALLIPPPSVVLAEEQEAQARQLRGVQVISEVLVTGSHPRAGFEPILLSSLDAEALRAALSEILARPDRAPDARAVAAPQEGLPADLRVRRFSSVDVGRTVVHILGEDAQVRELQLAGVLDRAKSSCVARVVDPWTGQRQALSCEPVEDAPWFARVFAPPVSGWSVIEVDRVVDTGGATSAVAWTVSAGQATSLDGRSVLLHPPPGGPLADVSLSVPEWLHADRDLSALVDEAKHGLRSISGMAGVEATTEGPGIRFAATVEGRVGGADMKLSLTNRTDEVWHEVRALVCASSGDRQGAWPFPLGGQEQVRGRFAGEFRSLSEARIDSGDPFYLELTGAEAPVTELSAPDGSLSLALGMDRSDVVGGNANNGICLHARPFFGTIEPGATREVRGRLRLEAQRPSSLFDVRWEKANTPTQASPLDDNWVSPCSEEGLRRRVEDDAMPRGQVHE